MLPSKGEKESKQRKRFPSCESVSGVDPPKKSGPVIERKLVAHFLAIFLRLDFWDSKVKAQVCVSGDLFIFSCLFDSAVWPRAEHTQ